MTRHYNIPPSTKETIDNYIAKGWHPGGFVTAVLANDLRTACASADRFNEQCIHEIVSYCYNEIPSDAWGSYALVEAWLNKFRPKDSADTTHE